MPTVIFRFVSGIEQVIETPIGTTMMRAAIENGVAGIAADCGGDCACATCHVYVDPAFNERLPSKSDAESEMLEFVAAERRPNSRLSCQLRMTPEISGIVLAVPESQF
jgi:2Fe-2S ferredoxin